MIRAQGISKAYLNSVGKISSEVLKDLAIEVPAGEKIAIMGPSGSGKTTLLNLLSSLDIPDKGEIIIDGQPFTAMKQPEILAFRNSKIGFVFQYHRLLPQCTLIENVLLPTLANSTDSHATAERAEMLLRHMGVWELRDRMPGELSGGECQRAAVARALINNPDILFADEPTGSLDAANADLLIDLLTGINREMNITLVLATHSKEIAKRMDKIYSIADGRLEIMKETAL